MRYGDLAYGSGVYGGVTPSYSFVSGADGFAGSALAIDLPIVRLSNVEVGGTVLFWYNFTDCGTVVAKIGSTEITPDNILSLTVNGKVWKLAYTLAVYASGIPLFRSLISQSLQLFDIRLYNSIKDENSVINYFDDVKGNHGSSYLPAYISL